MKRFFKKRDHRKILFWEISIQDYAIIERSGGYGTPGKLNSTILPSDKAAHYRALELIAKMEKVGYNEVTPLPAEQLGFSTTDAETQKEFLNCLELVSKGPANQFCFNPPASEDTLMELELELDIILPQSLRTFLLHYDGGFVCRDKTLKEITAKKMVPGSEEEFQFKLENSYPFFSVKEIKENYAYRNDIYWGSGIIPFCRTYNGEILTVWSVREAGQDSPVFDAFHEESPAVWKSLYTSFAYLFVDCIQHKGVFKTGWSEEA